MQEHDGFLTGGSISVYPTHQAVVGDTVAFSSTTILDTRLSLTRAYSNDGPPAAGSNLGKLGFGSNWAAINGEQNIPLLPSFTWNGGLNLWQFRGLDIVDNRYADSYGLSSSLTKIVGNHALKFGGEVDLFDVDGTPQFNPGSITIDNNWYAGNEWANFLLGDFTSFQFSRAIRTSSYNWYKGVYAEDTWNATPKLTLTAGLRYELPGSVSERHNDGTVMLPNVTENVNGAPAVGILALLDSPQYKSRGVDPNRYNLLSPRLGAAYRATNSTVLRAGYALVYLPIDLNEGILPLNSPVNLATTLTLNSATTLNYTIANPLGVGTPNEQAIIQPSGHSDPNFLSSYANTPQLQSVTSPVPSSKYPYMQQWNLTVGQQFNSQQSLQISYVGATSIHLPDTGNWNLNQLAYPYAQELATGAISAAQAQALRPHPSYQNFEDSNRWSGTVTYNALEAVYTMRLGAGTLNSAFTWSKAIGDTENQSPYLDQNTLGSFQNYNDQRQERSLLSYNIANRSVTNYIINLPFGRGQKFGANISPAVDRVIGGWAVNGITTFESGQPLALSQGAGNTYSSNWGAGVIRPDAQPGCAAPTSGSAQARLAQWFKTSCYANAGVLQFGANSPLVNYALGNEPRVDSKLLAPGLGNFDFTAQKNTKVTEKTNLEFRMEFFNIFNHPQFNNPTTNISAGPSFGTITSQKNGPRQMQAVLRFNF